jgi:plastocyanin domain-containing protein
MKTLNAVVSVLALSSFLLGGAAFAAQTPQKVQLTVTQNGFEPGEVKVKKDRPVALEITRKTDKTCAHHILIDEEEVKGGQAIKKELPLDETVVVTFTPAKSGEIKYGCAMNKMVGAVLSVQ